MDIILNEGASKEEVLEAINKCSEEDAVCSSDESIFKLAKILLVQEKIKNVTIQLLDSDGYAIKQVTSKQRDESQQSDQLNDRQKSVLKALEKVLMHCKKEGVQLVGYSDELVALPAHIQLNEISSSGALDINSFGVYKGADAIIPDSNI